MDRIKLSLDISNPSKFHNLGIELWLDNIKFFDNQVASGTHHVIYEFNEQQDTNREFKIILKNKTNEHTQIDQSGNILQDALINIHNIELDGINIDQLMWTHCEYFHTGNDSHDMQAHKFYGNLGCNGTVLLTFSTPSYLWLFENM